MNYVNVKPQTCFSSKTYAFDRILLETITKLTGALQLLAVGYKTRN